MEVSDEDRSYGTATALIVMAAGLGQAAHAQYPLVPLANPLADEARAAITKIVATGFWAGQKAYDYFKNVHGRNGWDNHGQQTWVRSRWYDNFAQGANAVWDGAAIRLGVGNPQYGYRNFSSLDITAHEWTHGVVQSTAFLNSGNEGGALNESFADIFGTATEFYVAAGNPNVQPNYLMGEFTYLYGSIRNLLDPTAPGTSGGGSDYYPTRPTLRPGESPSDSNDYGYTHYNAGIQNKVYALLSVGGTNRGYSISSIDHYRAERIFYRALTYKLWSSAGFRDAMIASLQSATDLYGYQSFEYQQVDKAWASVGVIY